MKKSTSDAKKPLDLKRRTIRLLAAPKLEVVQGGWSAQCSGDCITGSKWDC